jgi:hypothetical protein
MIVPLRGAKNWQLEGVEHRDDNKGSRFCGIRFRLPSDADKPCLITTHAPPVTDGTDTVTAETRTSDGCDACDACLHGLLRHLPTPATSVPIIQGGGVSIEECCNDPSNTSHPSLARGSGVTALSPPVTAPLAEEALAVGDGVWLCSPDRVQQHATPSHMMAITRWSKGEDYTLLTESPTGWLLARCERADPPRPSHGTHPPADTSGAVRRNPLRQARRNECVEDRRARHSPLAALVPCAKCGAVDRWHDPAADLWRCCRCWPPGTSAMDGIEGER